MSEKTIENMIDETAKLDEFEPVAKKYAELMGYFLEKSVNEDLSEEDEDRFFRIMQETQTHGYLSTFAEALATNPAKTAEIFKVGFEQIKDNQKNA